MADLGIVSSIGIMIVAATLVILLARRANVPSIVLYIITGLLLGPIGFDLLSIDLGHEGHGEDAVAVAAELGIVLLLFLVGLELSLDKIKAVGKVAVAAGLGQVVFTAAIGFGLALLLGFDTMAAIFLATALTFSSTVVVVKLLDQKDHLHKLYGRIAVGIFLVQDLVVVVVLTFLAGLGDTEVLDTATVAVDLGLAFLGMGAMLILALVAARYLLVKPMNWVASSAEATLIWSLCWCFAFVVGSEWLNLSPEIGAFLAGLSLAQLPIAHDLRRRVHPLMNFFIAIFFIALGAQMELSAATEHWLAAIIFSLFVIIGNPFIFMIIISRGGYSERTSFMTSVTVAQISEFSFIFAAVGLSAGLIDESILSLITIVGLITIGVSSYMILYNDPLYERVRKLGLLKPFRASQEDDETAEEPLSDHVIVVGMNAMGRRLVNDLYERGETILAIDTDARKLEDLPCHQLVGNINYPSVLADASLERAKLVVSTLRIEDTNNLLAYHSKKAGVPAAIHAFDPSVKDDLRRLDVDFLIDPKKSWLDEVITQIGQPLQNGETSHS
jgi:Kef-type K+ transport system membrane component KefB